MQEVLRRHGYMGLHIGGSGAREILDRLRFGVPLALRDLDIYVLKHAAVHAEDVHALCSDLKPLGELGPLREKRRATPAGEIRIVGAGAHLFVPGRPILSIGVLQLADDLALNGLFDIDTVMLAVADGDPPHRHVVVDPHDGYRAWRERSPRIVHWAEVERCLARNAFRIVRTLGKASVLRLPPDLAAEYRRRRPVRMVVDDELELHRDFLKVLGDPHWADELVMLADLNALELISASLQTRVERSSPDALRHALSAAPGTSPAVLASLRAEFLRIRFSQLESLLSLAFGKS